MPGCVSGHDSGTSLSWGGCRPGLPTPGSVGMRIWGLAVCMTCHRLTSLISHSLLYILLMIIAALWATAED